MKDAMTLGLKKCKGGTLYHRGKGRHTQGVGGQCMQRQ